MNKEQYISYAKGEKITEEEFKSVARMIALAYPPKSGEKSFLYDKDAGNLWFYMLKDKQYLPVLLGAFDYIRMNRFQPTIADINEYSENADKKLSEVHRLITYYCGEIEQYAHNLGKPDFKIKGDHYRNLLDAILSDNLDEIISNIKSFVAFIDTQDPQEEIEGWIEKWNDYLTKRKKP